MKSRSCSYLAKYANAEARFRVGQGGRKSQHDKWINKLFRNGASHTSVSAVGTTSLVSVFHRAGVDDTIDLEVLKLEPELLWLCTRTNNPATCGVSVENDETASARYNVWHHGVY